MRALVEHPKPRIVFSRCLGFEACRYNGNIIREPAVEQLVPYADVETFCPEVEIGLGVPRHPIRLIGEADAPKLVQPETGRDVTAEMLAFCEKRLLSIEPPDGAVLKFGSPSCGPREVKLYTSDKKGAAFSKTRGLFGGAVIDRFPLAIVEDEGRLKNFDIRQHFLTRVFTSARFRVALRGGTMRDLVAFHARHKLLLMAYSQAKMRELGRLVANPERRPTSSVFEDYGIGLDQALSRAPRRTSAINVLMHALGYVSDELKAGEKAFLLDALEQYRNHQAPLSVPTSLVRSWIIRFDVDYLADQVYFEPYPLELVQVLDSGKGRPLV